MLGIMFDPYQAYHNLSEEEKRKFNEAAEQISFDDIDSSSITPIEKYNMNLPQKIKAISIGFLGSQYCFLGVSKEEAIKKYKEKENCTDKDLEGLTVTDGYIVDGCFWNYEICLEDEKHSTL